MSTVKVLLATNIKAIDNRIQKEKNITVLDPVYYREAILESKEDFNVVILSSVIEGSIDLMDLAYQLRAQNKRVMYIDMNPNSDKEFLYGLIKLGIYDIMTNPIALTDLIHKITCPSSLGQAADVVGKTKDELFQELNRDEGRFKGMIKGLAGKKHEDAPQIIYDDFKEFEEDAGPEYAKLEQYEPEALTEPSQPEEGAGGCEIHETAQHPEQEDTIVEVMEETEAASGLMYTFLMSDSVLAEIDSVHDFSNWDDMNKRIQETRPSIIFLSANAPDLKENVSNLRKEERLRQVPIIAVGKTGNTKDYYAAGVDECIKDIDNESLGLVKTTAARLTRLWGAAPKDELTGLFTRKFLDNYLAEQTLKYEKAQAVFSVAMLDLDKLKDFNNTHGYEAGNTLLKDLARFLKDQLWETDMVIRYGGEEFLIVLPGCSHSYKVIDQIRDRWEQTIKDEARTTFSAGVAVFNGHNLDTIIAEAENALFMAKESGRNRVGEAPKNQEKWSYAKEPIVEGAEPLPVEPAPTQKANPELPKRVKQEVKQEAKQEVKQEENQEVKQEEKLQPKKEVQKPASPKHKAELTPKSVLSEPKKKKTVKPKMAKPVLPKIEKPKMPRRQTYQKQAQESSPGTKVIAIGAPWASTGSSTVAVILTNALAQDSKVSAVDCDFSDSGLGVRFGLPMSEVHDWRKTSTPITQNGVPVFPLDPTVKDVPDVERMDQVITEAQRGCAYTILDAGSFPDSEWFEVATSYASLFIWVINNDTLVVQKAIHRWSDRPKATCREIMVLFGEGDPEEMAANFLVPCVQIKSQEDRKGTRKLSQLIDAIPAERGKKVMTVGLDRLPKARGVIFEPFDSTDEAILWLQANTPQGAILAGSRGEYSLLEYDLIEKQVPIQKFSNPKAGDVLQWLQSL